MPIWVLKEDEPHYVTIISRGVKSVDRRSYAHKGPNHLPNDSGYLPFPHRGTLDGGEHIYWAITVSQGGIVQLKLSSRQLPMSITNWVRVFDAADCKDSVIYLQTPEGTQSNVTLKSIGNQMLTMMWLHKEFETHTCGARYDRLSWL
ncbi:hypothetical protein EG68_11833 [Paragonimus skrjabini miyazakii]|uniref:Uncharacterized protein n=1 Tax=Paragonimus skrjabini miyazakii TaxID=59628 RepID=A0A8S9YCG0_9TREM|nr:hypothetical protein EG68_11833 [Paragonimus skrjabini miyazakii]